MDLADLPMYYCFDADDRSRRETYAVNRNSTVLRRLLGATAVALWVCLAQLAPALAQDSTVTLSSNPATDACMQDQACLQQVFLSAALGGGQERLSKWTIPVRAGVYAAKNMPQDRQVIGARALQIMSSIGRSAGANLYAANIDPSNPVNLILFVSDDFERDRDGRFAAVIDRVFSGRPQVYDSLLAGEGPICVSRWSLDQLLAVTSAVAMVQTDLPPDGFEQCLYSTMIKMLGLTGGVPNHLESILNPAAGKTTWTALDFVLLGLMYHPLIEPGMTPRQIAEVFPWAYAEVMQKAG